MAVIFFEGFKTFDANYWTSFGPSSFGQETGRVVPGSVALQKISFNFNILPQYLVTGPMWLAGPLGLNFSTPQQCIALGNIGNHSNKKIYIGFGLKNFYLGGTTTLNMSDPGYPGVNSKIALFYLLNQRLPILGVFGGVEGLEYGAAVVESSEMWAGKYMASIDTTSAFNGPISNAGPGIMLVEGWNFFELELDLSVMPRTVRMRVNGMVYGSPTPIPLDVENETVLLNSSDPEISRINGIAFFNPHPRSDTWASAPMLVDDLYVVDNTGDRANMWLGADSVVYSATLNESEPLVNEWTTRQPESFQWEGKTALGTDDGDVSYIRTNTVNKTQLYSLNPINIIADDPTVGGVKVTTKARSVSLPSAYEHLYRAPNQTVYTISGAAQLGEPQYLNSSVILLTNPATNSHWNVADINNGGWGVRSVAPSP